MNKTSQTQTELHAAADALHRVAHDVWAAWTAVIGWAWTPHIAAIAVVTVAFVLITKAHRRWKKGWLSELITQRLSAIRKRRPSKQRALLRKLRFLKTEPRLTIIEHWDDLLTYLRSKFIADLRAPYFPSLVSFAIIAIPIALFFLIPTDRLL